MRAERRRKVAAEAYRVLVLALLGGWVFLFLTVVGARWLFGG